jgi:DNA repair exonuclease SbcCD nuclease subunit
MKVVASSDWHPDHVTHGVSRFQEVKEAAHRTVDRAIEESADLYAFVGDLCDPDTGSSVFRCVELAVDVATRLAARGIASAWVAGNHDVIEDGSGDTVLSPLRALANLTHLVKVFERPGVMDRAGGHVLCLPYTATSHAYDVEAAIAEFGPTVNKAKTIVLGHLNVAGIVPGEETTEMPRGREVWLPVEAAKRVARHVVNGHYHRRQRTKDGVWITGSLARLTFGEEGNEPSFLVLEV